MKVALRLAELALIGCRRALSSDEEREARALRRKMRDNDHLRHHYRTDPDYREHKLAYRRTMEAAE